MAADTGRRNAARNDRAPRIVFRRRPVPRDVPAVRRLVAATGVFHAEEQAVAVELVKERLERGRRSGYQFVFAEAAGELVGYTAWGPIPLTRASYDLYWIAVAPTHQGSGVGRALLAETERDVARRGGGRLYIETSSRGAYDRTRRFYHSAGYDEVARLADFYAAGDDKVMYCKRIGAEQPRRRARAPLPAR
ncbi:MAG TPA: GNAT family N-acetyltransferase [Gammaproteobacteria bacterium]